MLACIALAMCAAVWGCKQDPDVVATIEPLGDAGLGPVADGGADTGDPCPLPSWYDGFAAVGNSRDCSFEATAGDELLQAIQEYWHQHLTDATGGVSTPTGCDNGLELPFYRNPENSMYWFVCPGVCDWIHDQVTKAFNDQRACSAMHDPQP